jgi:hypothetical protein
MTKTTPSADWCYTVPGSDWPPVPHPDNYPTDDEIYETLAGIDQVWESAMNALWGGDDA